MAGSKTKCTVPRGVFQKCIKPTLDSLDMIVWRGGCTLERYWYSPDIAKIWPDSPWNNTRLRHMAVSTQLGHRKNIWKWQVLVHKTWISCQNLCLFRSNLHKKKPKNMSPYPITPWGAAVKEALIQPCGMEALGWLNFEKIPLKRMGPVGVYTYYKYSNINMKKHQCILYTY